jgi:hypothetical protein
MTLYLIISLSWNHFFFQSHFIGATANAISAIASHYPWFYTFRVLSHNPFLQKIISSNHLRNAFIGFASSVVSDTFANSIRVVKTAKQAIASKQAVSYGEVIAMILAVDGFKVSLFLYYFHFISLIMNQAAANIIKTLLYFIKPLKGLFGRGLRTRILGNALQSVLFTVIWRGLAERKNQNQPQGESRRSLKDESLDEKFMEEIPDKDDVPLQEERF